MKWTDKGHQYDALGAKFGEVESLFICGDEFSLANYYIEKPLAEVLAFLNLPVHQLRIPLVFRGMDVKYIFMYGCYFWMGALLWRTRLLALLPSKKGSLLLIACLFFYAPMFKASGLPVILPVLIISIALINTRYTHIINTNDILYGIYLYSFPVQQTVIYLCPEIPFSLYMLSCGGCIGICSPLSCHLLEKRALRLKPKKK